MALEAHDLFVVADAVSVEHRFLQDAHLINALPLEHFAEDVPQVRAVALDDLRLEGREFFDCLGKEIEARLEVEARMLALLLSHLGEMLQSAFQGVKDELAGVKHIAALLVHAQDVGIQGYFTYIGGRCQMQEIAKFVKRRLIGMRQILVNDDGRFLFALVMKGDVHIDLAARREFLDGMAHIVLKDIESARHGKRYVQIPLIDRFHFHMNLVILILPARRAEPRHALHANSPPFLLIQGTANLLSVSFILLYQGILPHFSPLRQGFMPPYGRRVRHEAGGRDCSP